MRYYLVITERSIILVLVVVGQVDVPINTQAVGHHHIVGFVSSQGKPTYYYESNKQVDSSRNQENHGGNGLAIHLHTYSQQSEFNTTCTLQSEDQAAYQEQHTHPRDNGTNNQRRLGCCGWALTKHKGQMRLVGRLGQV